MNWDQIEGQWKQLGSQVKAKWAKLTDDDVKALSARKDDLIGKIQERYGVMRDAAEAQVDEWLKELKPQPRQGDPRDEERSSRPSVTR
jgi:uncharacterized protein YjbJ (UPF0337 family)